MPMKKITFNAQAVLVAVRMKSMLLLRNTPSQRKSIVDS